MLCRRHRRPVPEPSRGPKRRHCAHQAAALHPRPSPQPPGTRRFAFCLYGLACSGRVIGTPRTERAPRGWLHPGWGLRRYFGPFNCEQRSAAWPRHVYSPRHPLMAQRAVFTCWRSRTALPRTAACTSRGRGRLHPSAGLAGVHPGVELPGHRVALPLTS